jgi:thiol-disulfide isomerase/thioredoxin
MSYLNPQTYTTIHQKCTTTHFKHVGGGLLVFKQSSGINASMVSIIKTVLMFTCLTTASGAVTPIAFSTLQSSTATRLVVFHDPNVQKSTDAVGIMQAIDTANTYETEYEFNFCDSSDPQNFEGLKAAGFNMYPHIFVQTVEGGIEPFSVDLTIESFARFHDFRIMHITSDSVHRMKTSDGAGTVEGAAGLLELSVAKPVMVKMYEEWCGHCTKLKKHYQFVSNLASEAINNAILLEVECSKVPNGFCNDMDVKGYPTIVLVYKEKIMKYTGGRTHGAITEFLSDKSKWLFEDLPPNIAKFLPQNRDDIEDAAAIDDDAVGDEGDDAAGDGDDLEDVDEL